MCPEALLRDDERSRRLEHFIRRQRGLDCCRERAVPDDEIQVCSVASLDGNDSAGSQQEINALDGGRGSVIGLNAEVLNRGGGREVALGVRHAKVVLGRLNRLTTEIGDDCGQRIDVCGLMLADDRQVISDRIAETVFGELVVASLLIESLPAQRAQIETLPDGMMAGRPSPD